MSKTEGTVGIGKWSTDVPTEDGFYWFWGFLFSLDKTSGGKPKMEIIQVRRIHNGVVYMAHNAILDPRSDMIGYFQLAERPEPPKPSAHKETQCQQGQ